MNHLVIAESHRDYVVATSFSDRYADKFATASRDGTVRYCSTTSILCDAMIQFILIAAILLCALLCDSVQCILCVAPCYRYASLVTESGMWWNIQ